MESPIFTIDQLSGPQFSESADKAKALLPTTNFLRHNASRLILSEREWRVWQLREPFASSSRRPAIWLSSGERSRM